jgi:hypothetical protein
MRDFLQAVSAIIYLFGNAGFKNESAKAMPMKRRRPGTRHNGRYGGRIRGKPSNRGLALLNG